MEHVISATDISHSLKGVKFPADKKQLTELCQQNNAPQDVCDIVNSLPEDGQYRSMPDVEHGFSLVHGRRSSSSTSGNQGKTQAGGQREKGEREVENAS